MYLFHQKLLLVFFTSFGVVLGASLIGSLGAVIVGHPPVEIMLRLAQEIKIWAIVAAIGGTFTTLEILQLGILEGEIRTLAKQLFYLLSAFIGAQLGYQIIVSITGNSK